MPNTTPNLGLIKPLVTEQYDIAKVTNENADILDIEIKAVKDDILDKQDTLVSGTNIKTINGEPILGSGNIDIEGGSGGATYNVYTATIPNTSWTGSSAPYSKAVAVTGLLSTDEPIIDLVLTGTYATDVTMRENWSKIYRGVTSADSITFYADSIPSANISIQLVVVR